MFEIESFAFTQNEQYFFAFKDKLVGRYKAIYRMSKGQSSLAAKLQGPLLDIEPGSTVSPIAPAALTAQEGQYIATALSNLAALQFEGLTRVDLLKLLPSSEMDPAFDIMAEVRAYWQGAHNPQHSADMSA
jgi:hypothetical protein